MYRPSYRPSYRPWVVTVPDREIPYDRMGVSIKSLVRVPSDFIRMVCADSPNK